MNKLNLEHLEKTVARKIKRRDNKNKPKMKVVGKQVFKLKKIIAAK